jgi:adenosine deaminase
MCPTSNMFTMYLKDYREHHFIKYYQSGHPLVLCTDDTGVFDTTLSEEYYRIMEAFDFYVDQAKDIVKRSYNCVMDDKVKKELNDIQL